MIKSQRIAVVGSGIAGTAAAWLLGKQHSVWLFEKNRYFGGHTHTMMVEDKGQGLPIDTGFIVYNEPNYPHLTGLFDHLGIATRETEMTFAASVGEPPIEYAGSYFGYGFHEDALRASVELAERFGIQAPWRAAGQGGETRAVR